MPKSDSGKKLKKLSSSTDGGQPKKLKSSSSSSTSDSKERRSSTTQADLTMTIPRKKDKDGSVTKKSRSENQQQQQQQQTTGISLLRIPKKSDKANASNGSDKELLGTIPKKVKDNQKSSSSSFSYSSKGDGTKGSNSSERDEKRSSRADVTDKEDPAGTHADETSKSTKDDLSGPVKKSTKSDKQSATKGDKVKSSVDSETIEKDKEYEKQGKTEKEGRRGSSANVGDATNAPRKSTKAEKANNKSNTKTERNSNKTEKEKVKNRSEKGDRLDKDKTSKKQDKDKTKPLKIDTSLVGGEYTKPGKSPGPSSGTAMDSHPYARGSVIEVLHGVADSASDNAVADTNDDDDWWDKDSDEEENDDGEGDDENASVSKKKTSVRLCDIIDRISIGEKKWRYYVHYRDFNRRMDEWVSMDRIVSPPSVGNAKARAIKKEEERQKRKQQRLEEKNAAENVDVSAPRASRRRSAVMSQQQPSNTTDTAGTAAAAADTEAETPRRTRLQRRKSVDDDTVVASNQHDKRNNEGSHDPVPGVVMAAEKGIVAIPTQAATHTTVGEHVVATIPAQELDEHEGLDEASLREHEEVTKVKNVSFVELGAFQMETWYFSPLPKELLSEKGLIEVLYVCEFTFSLFSRKSELRRFQSRLPTHARHPPGNEIYRKGNISMFEIDGFEERIYCQNLCYIAKLFLDHKTLYFDVDPFLFYVLCEVDERGFHPVGYYSKEKYSDVGYNLACILTFPCHQRKGYGRFLIAFSYELSKKEEKVGSPEKPMSDLGQQAYKPYWASTIVDFLLNQNDSSSMSIMDIAKKTSIMAEDIVFTLNQLGLLKIINSVYFIAAEEGLLRTLAKKYPVKEPKVDPTKLHWTPFLTGIKRDKFSIHSKKPNLDSE